MEERILIKYVKKANSFCRTTFTYNKDGKIKQTQEWFGTKEEAEKK